MGITYDEVTSTQLSNGAADNGGMTIKTTLAALLLSACTIPGLTTGSTLSAGSSSPATPAEPATGVAASAPAAPAADSPAPPPLTPRDVDAIDTAATVLAQITAGTLTPGSGMREQYLRDDAMFCSQRVETLIAQGNPRSAKLPLAAAKVTLGEADATICQPLAKAADGWTEREKAAYAAQNDAVLEPYRKAGVAGDKLELVDDLGKQLIGPGRADPTPAVVAKASVLFSLRHDGFRQWTIVRYAFKGNTQVSVTEKGYRDQPGPDQYR
jgi:hypothetical protein